MGHAKPLRLLATHAQGHDEDERPEVAKKARSREREAAKSSKGLEAAKPLLGWPVLGALRPKLSSMG